MMNSEPDPSPNLEIDISVASSDWQERLPDFEELCGVAVRAVLRDSGRNPEGPAELSLMLADDALLRRLNREWRGKDRPTNVLSFAAGDPPPPGAPLLLGDVVLAFETVAAEAAAQGKPLAHHFSHLIVHGVLHLLGFDHESPAEAEAMEALEIRALASLGVPDPYREREAAHG